MYCDECGSPVTYREEPPSPAGLPAPLVARLAAAVAAFTRRQSAAFAAVSPALRRFTVAFAPTSREPIQIPPRDYQFLEDRIPHE